MIYRAHNFIYTNTHTHNNSSKNKESHKNIYCYDMEFSLFNSELKKPAFCVSPALNKNVLALDGLTDETQTFIVIIVHTH